MLGSSESQRASLGACPVNHADVFVSVRDAMDVQKAGSDQGASSRRGGGWAFANQFDFKAAFFPGFAEGGLFGIFVKFDMAAEREPFVELTMMDEQNFVIANDEDCDCEINFFVNVRHGD
jgi:hypothetical protein